MFETIKNLNNQFNSYYTNKYKFIIGNIDTCCEKDIINTKKTKKQKKRKHVKNKDDQKECEYILLSVEKFNNTFTYDINKDKLKEKIIYYPENYDNEINYSIYLTRLPFIFFSISRNNDFININELKNYLKSKNIDNIEKIINLINNDRINFTDFMRIFL